MTTLFRTILFCALIGSEVAADACTGSLFQPPVQYSASADEVVLLADVNGDGAPEILTSGNHTDQVDAFSLLMNRGDGTFTSEQRVGSRFGEKLEEIVDLDGDGLVDIVASNYWMNGISVYRGTSSQQFSAGMFHETATHGGPTRVVDYDRDGVLDIASLSFGSRQPVRVHLLRGLAGGTFDQKVTFETPLGVAASPSTRLHQGAVEVLVEEYSGHLAILRLAAAGVSIEILSVGPGMDLSSMFADINGDGIADIVDTTDGRSNGMSAHNELIFVTLAAPGGGFQERTQLARKRKLTYPVELGAGDFNGDGRLDLIAGDVLAASLYYYLGNAAGSFNGGIEIDVGGPVNDIALGDVNRDGRLDLVVANNNRSVAVSVNRGPCVPTRRRAVRH
ncbi:MAG TPA: VCBS repeat-containing protein [Thermoanaerobaculia bacterium]|nr:VCBS repeat-containing protein [Thermoanaerobaculia bacterium]